MATTTIAYQYTLEKKSLTLKWRVMTNASSLAYETTKVQLPTERFPTEISDTTELSCFKQQVVTGFQVLAGDSTLPKMRLCSKLSCDEV